MIVKWLFKESFGFIAWVLSMIPADVQAVDLMTTVIRYVSYVFTKGGDIFFLFVPEQAFEVACDVMFFWLIHTPGWAALMWALRKIPFLGIE